MHFVDGLVQKGRRIFIRSLRYRLKNKDFSLIASNCNGGWILHDLGLQFNSPFVNLWMKPEDYIKMLRNIKKYMSMELVFINCEDKPYPVGYLGKDSERVTIYFQHYSDEDEARGKWENRKKRINYNNLFILFSDRDGCTYEHLKEFDSLPFANRVVFTNRRHPELTSCVYIPGFESEESVGLCSDWKSRYSLKKYYNEFDFVRWFNAQ